MSYAALADVQGLIKQFTISDTSKVKAAEVTDDILPDADRYIDDRLGRYYKVPITGANAVLTMKRIEKYLGAAEVLRRTYAGQTPNDSPQGQEFQTIADAEIQSIIDGEIILYDATPTDETPESKAARIRDKLSDPANENGPYFTDGMDF